MILDDEIMQEARNEVEAALDGKSPDYRLGYEAGTLDSAKGFYAAVKEIHDLDVSRDDQLALIAQFMIAIGTVLVASGRLTIYEF